MRHKSTMQNCLDARQSPIARSFQKNQRLIKLIMNYDRNPFQRLEFYWNFRRKKWLRRHSLLAFHEISRTMMMESKNMKQKKVKYLYRCWVPAKSVHETRAARKKEILAVYFKHFYKRLHLIGFMLHSSNCEPPYFVSSCVWSSALTGTSPPWLLHYTPLLVCVWVNSV